VVFTSWDRDFGSSSFRHGLWEDDFLFTKVGEGEILLELVVSWVINIEEAQWSIDFITTSSKSLHAREETIAIQEVLERVLIDVVICNVKYALGKEAYSVRVVHSLKSDGLVGVNVDVQVLVVLVEISGIVEHGRDSDDVFTCWQVGVLVDVRSLEPILHCRTDVGTIFFHKDNRGVRGLERSISSSIVLESWSHLVDRDSECVLNHTLVVWSSINILSEFKGVEGDWALNVAVVEPVNVARVLVFGIIKHSNEVS